VYKRQEYIYASRWGNGNFGGEFLFYLNEAMIYGTIVNVNHMAEFIPRPKAEGSLKKRRKIYEGY